VWCEDKGSMYSNYEDIHGLEIQGKKNKHYHENTSKEKERKQWTKKGKEKCNKRKYTDI
jgi:hypothetical protein